MKFGAESITTDLGAVAMDPEDQINARASLIAYRRRTGDHVVDIAAALGISRPPSPETDAP